MIVYIDLPPCFFVLKRQQKTVAQRNINLPCTFDMPNIKMHWKSHWEQNAFWFLCCSTKTRESISKQYWVQLFFFFFISVSRHCLCLQQCYVRYPLVMELMQMVITKVYLIALHHSIVWAE